MGSRHINDDRIAALLEDDDAVIAATEALYRDATTAAKGLGDVVEALNAITDGYASGVVVRHVRGIVHGRRRLRPRAAADGASPHATVGWGAPSH